MGRYMYTHEEDERAREEEKRNRDKYYEGHKAGYRYDGDGYYSSIHGGGDLIWDDVEGMYMSTM